MISFLILQNSLKPGERSACDPDFLSQLQERPRLPGQLRLNNSLNRGNFRIVDRDWILAISDHLDHAGRHEDGKPIQQIKSTKQVARKQRQLDSLDTIGP